MLRRTKKNAGFRPGDSEQGPVQKMHRHLVWVLGAATGALIVNAVVVVALVDQG